MRSSLIWRSSASALSLNTKMRRLIAPKRINAVIPPNTGESTQDTAMRPISPHCTISRPPMCKKNPRVSDAPTMPPMMECVVDTGSPSLVAMSSHTAAPNNAAIMMNAKCMASRWMDSKSTMPLLTVSVTSPPANTAPDTSKIAATTSACRIVSVPAPTEVPKELATSLPPMLNAIKTPNAMVVMRITLFASGPT